MAPYISTIDVIPTDTENAIVKASSPVIDMALLSSYVCKMTSLHLWHGILSFNIGKKLIIQAKDFIDMTEIVFKKFNDVKLSEKGCKQEAPPTKKRKLCYFNLRKTPPKKDTRIEEVRPSTPSPHLPHDSLAVVKYEAYESGEVLSFSPFQCKVKIPVMTKRRFIEFGRDTTAVHKRRSSMKKLPPFLRMSIETTPIDRAASLGRCFFRGCVNFVHASKLFEEIDVDASIKFISECGKMICWQDHWVEKGSRTLWMGALVTYSRTVDSDHIFKTSFLGTYPRLLPLDVKRHLHLIAQMETRLLAFGDQRMNSSTSVFVEKVPSKGSREKLKKDLWGYGEVESLHWVENTGWKSCTCVVSFRYAVEAYAVALAFDGKRFNRSILKARLEITEKLRRLHLMVSGSYN